MLDDNTKGQLATYFERISHPVELIASLDDSAGATDIRELVTEITAIAPDKISATLLKKLVQSDGCTFAQYVAARKLVGECQRMLDDVFGDFDVLLVPSAPGEAPHGLKSTGEATFNRMWTALHVPAVTVPAFTGPAGLPIGAQLIAKRNADRTLFSAAQWVWNALGRH